LPGILARHEIFGYIFFAALKSLLFLLITPLAALYFNAYTPRIDLLRHNFKFFIHPPAQKNNSPIIPAR
jgi:hypothetical protein